MAESGNRPKIMGCITELDIGGAEKAFVRILTGLKVRGWDVEAVSLRDSGPLAAELKDHQIPVTALNCKALWDFRAFWRLRRLVQSSMPDVVLSFLHQANFYGRLAVSARNPAVVVSGVRVADGRKSVTWLDSWTSGFVDQYVGVSSGVMQKHAEWCGLSPDRCSSIPNGVDVPASIDESQRPANRLLFVGRLTAQKSPQTLLDAFSSLRRQGRDVQLQIVGDGPLKPALQQQAKRLQLGSHVEFLGHRSDISNLMQQASLLVLPSLWEGMPNVVLEAMANGLPVVCTNIDGVRDVVTHQKTGWLVKPGCAESLASAVDELLSDSTLRRSIASAATQLVSSEYRWEDVVDRYDKLLKGRLS